MVETLETHYTRSADGTDLAYQVSGEGPIDIVFMLGAAVPIDLMWDDPGLTRVRQRLAVFSRTMWFEARGLGASAGDPAQTARGEQFNEDLDAVLSDAQFERVVLLGASTLGSNAICFAANHPHRVSALILATTWAHYLRHPDYGFGVPIDRLDAFANWSAQTWGTSANVDILAPSRAKDERFRAWWARCSRLGLSPEQLREMTKAAFGRDVRPLLASIQVPTLVIHRQGDRYIRADSGRYLAEHIPNAKLVILPGDDHLLFVGDTDALVDEMEDFLTGRHQAPEGDVVLAAVLFTDIVGSTRQAARLGPRAWRNLLEEHDAIIRAALRQHGGREIKTIGDGFLATFDGGTRAVRCAMEITQSTEPLPLDVRVGIHCGEVELRGSDVAGMAVTIAKRVCDLAGPGQVLLSETMRELIVGSALTVSLDGTHVLKGVPGKWRIWSLQRHPT